MQSRSVSGGSTKTETEFSVGSATTDMESELSPAHLPSSAVPCSGKRVSCQPAFCVLTGCRRSPEYGRVSVPDSGAAAFFVVIDWSLMCHLSTISSSSSKISGSRLTPASGILAQTTLNAAERKKSTYKIQEVNNDSIINNLCHAG